MPHSGPVADQREPKPKQWVLYLLECRAGDRDSLYAGITNDMPARLAAHISGKGAKYTRANRPVRVLATCDFADRASASSAEWHLKKQPRARKLAFLQEQGECSHDQVDCDCGRGILR